MKKRIAINGFGRIGRMLARVLLIQEGASLELAAINDVWDIRTMANLLKYDSVHGRFPLPIEIDGSNLLINGHRIAYSQESELENLSWGKYDVHTVIECSGKFKLREELKTHISCGAKRVVLSAPSPDSSIKMIVYGVNDAILKEEDDIISCASCTTNNAAPMIALLDEVCGITGCYITTVHSYTGDQGLHDSPHKDWRRGRAASESIVPTTTGAAKALTSIFPHLSEVMGGCGIRVPVPDGSLTDITCIVEKAPNAARINTLFAQAAKHRFKGILDYTEDAIVSRDIIGNAFSCTIDAQLTSVIGNMVKVVGWYDNEVGYSNRILDVLKMWG